MSVCGVSPISQSKPVDTTSMAEGPVDLLSFDGERFLRWEFSLLAWTMGVLVSASPALVTLPLFLASVTAMGVEDDEDDEDDFCDFGGDDFDMGGPSSEHTSPAAGRSSQESSFSVSPLSLYGVCRVNALVFCTKFLPFFCTNR